MSVVDSIEQCFYRDSKENKGSAIQISSFRGKKNDLVVLLSIAPQAGRNESGNATYSWKEKKQQVSLSGSDLSTFALVTSGKVKSATFFRDPTKRGGTGPIITCGLKWDERTRKTREGAEYKEAFLQCSIGSKEGSCSFYLSVSEAYYFSKLADHFIVLTSESTRALRPNSNEADTSFDVASFGTPAPTGASNANFSPSNENYPFSTSPDSPFSGMVDD